LRKEKTVAEISSFFWECMSPTKSQPSAAIVDALNLHFGGVEKFREKFSHNALAVFGR
jgi:Fe-Mn family superoxide dismutase